MWQWLSGVLDHLLVGLPQGTLLPTTEKAGEPASGTRFCSDFFEGLGGPSLD